MKPRVLVGIGLFLFLILNLADLTKYGETYDEKHSFERGVYSLKLASSILVGTGNFSQKDLEYLRALHHPPFFAMLNAGAIAIGDELGLDCEAAKHYFIVFWAVGGLMFLFLLVSRAFDDWVGLAAVAFLMLFPRFIAHAHYNPKDIPLLVMVIATFFFFERFLTARTSAAAAMAGAIFGLTCATSFNAFFILPALIAGWVVAQKRTGPRLRWEIYCAFAFIAMFFSWPLLWVFPRSLWDSGRFFLTDFLQPYVLYLGVFYKAPELPWHYTPINLFATVPLVTFLSCVVGAWRLHVKRSILNQTYLQTMLPWWLIFPVASRMIPGVTRYDGMRHVFISVAPIVIYAALGFCTLANRNRALKVLLCLLVPGWLLYEIALVHPFEGSYVNEAVRIAFPGDLMNQFDLQIGAAQCRQGTEWLNKNAPANAKVCLRTHQFLSCLKRPDIRLDCADPDFDMVVPILGQEFDASGRTPVFSIVRYNAPLLLIYKKS